MNTPERLAALETINKLLKEHVSGYVITIAWMDPEDHGIEDTMTTAYTGGLNNAMGCAQYQSLYLAELAKVRIEEVMQAHRDEDEGDGADV